MWYNINMKLRKKIDKIMTKIKGFYGFILLALILLPFHFSWAVSTITNPLGGTKTLPQFIQALIQNVVIPIGVPIATLFLVFSGFLIIKAQGKPEELTKAKETFMWTIIGIAVLLGAWVLSEGIQATIIQLGR